MTLRLQLISITNLPEVVSGPIQTSVVYVEGSEAGPLVSKTGKSPLNFVAICNSQNVLNVEIYQTFKTKLIGQTTFSANRFLRENRYVPKLYEGQQIVYKTNIFDKIERPCGTIVFSIKYTPGVKFVGQKIGIFESLPDREPVKIYKGACETKNMFSFCDQGLQQTPFRAVEETYRDQTWGKH